VINPCPIASFRGGDTGGAGSPTGRVRRRVRRPAGSVDSPGIRRPLRLPQRPLAPGVKTLGSSRYDDFSVGAVQHDDLGEEALNPRFFESDLPTSPDVRPTADSSACRLSFDCELVVGPCSHPRAFRNRRRLVVDVAEWLGPVRAHAACPRSERRSAPVARLPLRCGGGIPPFD
jgi:hypothetical protein